MSTTGLPITEGSGTASVATELVGGNSFQQIEVVGQGGASVLAVNNDGTLNARIIGSVLTAGSFTGSVSGTVGASIIGTVPVVQSGTNITSISGVVNASVSGTAGASIIGTVPVVQSGTVITSISGVVNASVSGQIGASIIGIVPVAIISGGTGGGSVSGTVGASIVGQLPSGTATIGSVAALQGTNPWIITGSVQGTFSPPANQSVSGTVGASIIGLVPVNIVSGGTTGSVSGTVGASIIGTAPVTQAGTWIASVFGNVSVLGTVPVTQSGAWSVSVIGATANQSVSGTIGASIIGQLPAGNAIIGAVAASISGTVTTTFSGSPSISGAVTIVGATIPPGSVSGSVGIVGNPSISGTVNVAGLQGSSVSGTVAVTEQGAWTTSVVGGPITLYAPPSSFVSGAPSVITGTSSVILLPTAAGGQRNYVTQVLVTNAAAVGTTVNLIDAGAVVYSGYAAASGGGFSVAFPFPLRQTSLAGSLGVQAGTAASVYVSASGYTAP